MHRVVTIALSMLFSLASFAQETTVTIDISQLDHSGFSEGCLFIRYASYSSRIPAEEETLSIKVKNLPTLIELRTLNKHKFTSQKLIWVEQANLVIEGSIKSKTISPIPFTDLQAITDQINKNKKPDPVKEPELTFSKPYLVHLNRQRKFLKNKYLEQLVELAPESVREFWAFKSMAAFVEGQKSVGYDTDTKVFSHLTAINTSKEEHLVELSGDKLMLIDFSSSSCRPCLLDIPKMAKIHNEYSDRLDMVTMWDDATYETWTKAAAKLKEQIIWTSLWDESGIVYKRFNIKILPTYALFDKSGKLLKTWHKPPKNLSKYL